MIIIEMLLIIGGAVILMLAFEAGRYYEKSKGK